MFHAKENREIGKTIRKLLKKFLIQKWVEITFYSINCFLASLITLVRRSIRDNMWNFGKPALNISNFFQLKIQVFVWHFNYSAKNSFFFWFRINLLDWMIIHFAWKCNCLVKNVLIANLSILLNIRIFSLNSTVLH